LQTGADHERVVESLAKSGADESTAKLLESTIKRLESRWFVFRCAGHSGGMALGRDHTGEAFPRNRAMSSEGVTSFRRNAFATWSGARSIPPE
jgi:hypothetical protein